jgi:hypothetical protein
LRTRFWSFASYFVIASALWTPLLVGSTALFGDHFLRSLFGGSSHSTAAFATTSIALAGTYTRRRRLVGLLKRIVRWEFWPPWLTYIPLLPYFAFLAVRYRSLTLFTAANPGIPSGGFVGESKSEILSQLSSSGAVARFEVLSKYTAPTDVEFPVVLKPDIGERGSGVAVIRSRGEMQRYLSAAKGTIILQQYVVGLEFGVFYYRYPQEERGRIFSITEKRFPAVIGDGRTRLLDLILNDDRAVCIASAYAQSSKRPLEDVPAGGERVQLVELGSHCRGAIFLDGTHLITAALERAIDQVSQAHSGFYFGRFDVRTPSIEALQHGIFCVIELNGVSSEATHIYDPAVSLTETYRVLFRQWRIAFEIGAANRLRGFHPMSLGGLARLVWSRFNEPTASAIDSTRSHPAPAEDHPAAS